MVSKVSFRRIARRLKNGGQMTLTVRDRSGTRYVRLSGDLTA